jgi:N6-adenosine-specific RNA methylase IME4
MDIDEWEEKNKDKLRRPMETGVRPPAAVELKTPDSIPENITPPVTEVQEGDASTIGDEGVIYDSGEVIADGSDNQEARRRGRPPGSKSLRHRMPKSGFILPSGMSITGWELPQGMSLVEWKVAIQQLQKAEGGVQWWFGDAWIYGKAQRWWVVGEGEDFAAELGVDYGTIRVNASVALAWPKEERDPELSFTHHRMLAPLDREQRQYWIERIKKEKLSQSKLVGLMKQRNAISRTHVIPLLGAEGTETAAGEYAVIYADPPWRYEDPPMGAGNRSIENQYPTMSHAEICALPVYRVAAKDSILYLWAPSAHLFNAMIVMQTWGFDYKTCMVWVKDVPGMGYYARQQHETLLIGRRGDPGVPDASTRINSVIEAPRGAHSVKPREFIDMIDQCWPGIRKLELFARPGDAIRSGWSVWGNEAVHALHRQTVAAPEAADGFTDESDNWDDEEAIAG